MNKLGWGREGGREEASEMHGRMKCTCMLLSLSLLDIYTCSLLHSLYGVVVCRLKNMCHQYNIYSTFRISSHAQN